MKKTWNPMLDSRSYFAVGFDLAKGGGPWGRQPSSPPDSVGGMVLNVGLIHSRPALLLQNQKTNAHGKDSATAESFVFGRAR